MSTSIDRFGHYVGDDTPSGEIRRIAAAIVAKHRNWPIIILVALTAFSTLGVIVCVTLAMVHGASNPGIPYSADATAMHLRSGYSVFTFGVFTFGAALAVFRRIDTAAKERRRMEIETEEARRHDTVARNEALARVLGMVRKNAELLEHLAETQATALATHRQWAVQLVTQVDAAGEQRLSAAVAQIVGVIDRYRTELGAAANDARDRHEQTRKVFEQQHDDLAERLAADLAATERLGRELGKLINDNRAQALGVTRRISEVEAAVEGVVDRVDGLADVVLAQTAQLAEMGTDGVMQLPTPEQRRVVETLVRRTIEQADRKIASDKISDTSPCGNGEEPE